MKLVAEVFHEIRNQKGPQVADRKEPLIMEKVSKQPGKGKKQRVLGEVEVVNPQQYKGLGVEVKVEMIQGVDHAGADACE